MDKSFRKWLARADQDDVFVPVELAEVREAIEHGIGIAQGRVLKNEMCPSVETAMHSLLLQRVVIHVHSINAIAWAIRVDGKEQLKLTL